MASRIKKAVVSMVSLVDRGANQHSDVVLMKSDESDPEMEEIFTKAKGEGLGDKSKEAHDTGNSGGADSKRRGKGLGHTDEDADGPSDDPTNEDSGRTRGDLGSDGLGANDRGKEDVSDEGDDGVSDVEPSDNHKNSKGRSKLRKALVNNDINNTSTVQGTQTEKDTMPDTKTEEAQDLSKLSHEDLLKYAEALEDEILKADDDTSGDDTDTEDIVKGLSPEAQAMFSEMSKRLDDAETIAKAERETRLDAEFLAKAETLNDLGENPETLRDLLKSLHEQCEPAVFDSTVALLTKSNTLVHESSIFDEIGKSYYDDTPADTEAKAEALRKSDPTLTEAQAFAKSIDADAYNEYLKTKEGR